MDQGRATQPSMSDEQFLAWAERREGRYEIVEGEIMMQAGATRDHERVAKRVFMALASQVDESAFDVNKGDFGVRIKPGRGRGTILYPDVIVDTQSTRGSQRTTTTPIVIVEVLSRSTDYDRHVEKLALYAGRATLRQYVVFEQTVPRSYIWSKSDKVWMTAPTIVAGLDAVVHFPSVCAELKMAEIYRPIEPRSRFGRRP